MFNTISSYKGEEKTLLSNEDLLNVLEERINIKISEGLKKAMTLVVQKLDSLVQSKVKELVQDSIKEIELEKTKNIVPSIKDGQQR